MPKRARDSRRQETPASVLLGELTLAAGFSGRSVALCFGEYSAPVLCTLWNNLTRGFDAGSVLQINSRADLRKLEKNFEKTRLAIVHSQRIYLDTNWSINLRPRAEATQVPAIFTSFAPDDRDGNPAPTLTLSANVSELNAVSTWLLRNELPRINWGRTQEIAQENPNASDIDSDSEILLGLGERISSLQDLHVVRGLMAGACLLRSANTPSSSDRNLSVTAEDYECVRSLLVSHVVSASNCPVEELAVSMVNRANVYLEVKYGGNCARLSELNDQADSRSNDVPITRREIADLGNTKSKLVRSLIEHLKQIRGGHDHLTSMGLVGRAPRMENWTRHTTESLCTLLRAWSPKQVRTHFSRLQREGLITANRQSANGAWVYQLPESLAAVTNRFTSLPRTIRASRPAV
jgi:hypothetical protein